MLVVIYFLVNFWSVKVFADTNSAITFFKLIVPAATAIALMCTGFHPEKFQVGIHGGRHVGNLAAILTAVATSGIVFSYNGFQSPVNLAGEARHPGPQRALRHFRLHRAEHRGVLAAAGRVPGRGRAGSSAARAGRRWNTARRSRSSRSP